MGERILQEAKVTYQKFLKLPADEQEKVRPTCIVNARALAIRRLVATLHATMYDLLISKRRNACEDAMFEVMRASKRGERSSSWEEESQDRGYQFPIGFDSEGDSEQGFVLEDCQRQVD